MLFPPQWFFLVSASQAATAATAMLLAAGSSLLLVLLVGPRAIAWLGRHCPEPVHSPSPELRVRQASKEGTPTLGGLIVLAAALGSGAVLVDGHSAAAQTSLAVVSGLAGIGLLDDALKLRRRSDGLRAGTKFVLQLAVTWPALELLASQRPAWDLFVPGLGPVPLGERMFVALGLFTVVGSANAVNLTDGLDGLAAGCWLLVAAGLAAVLLGWSFRQPLPEAVALLDQTEWLTVFAALWGAVAGFWWFNRYPAQVFLGDTGALALGGALGLVAVATGCALVLAALGLVFVLETLSVVVQKTSRRWWGRRVFHCAPLHHHFQFAGVAEPVVVRRFVFGTLVSVATASAWLVFQPVAARQAPSPAPAGLPARSPGAEATAGARATALSAVDKIEPAAAKNLEKLPGARTPGANAESRIREHFRISAAARPWAEPAYDFSPRLLGPRTGKVLR